MFNLQNLTGNPASSHYVPFLNDRDSRSIRNSRNEARTNSQKTDANSSTVLPRKIRLLLVPLTITVVGLFFVAIVFSRRDDADSAPAGVQATVDKAAVSMRGVSSSPASTAEALTHFRSILENPATPRDAFEAWMIVHEKEYASLEEKEARFAIFKDNLKHINSHNAQNFRYKLGVNHMSDLTKEEFKKRYNGYQNKPASMKSTRVATELLNVPAEEIPDAVDWREKKCVTPVKDQQDCGSCYAFSATGSLEGQVCVKEGQLHSFSEQEIVDCSAPQGDMGCNGGLMDHVFEYVMQRGGLCSEEDYPYTGRTGRCRAKKCTPKYGKITRFTDVPHFNETALEAAIAKYGPVSVAVDAVEWQHYQGGIFEKKCGTQLDHGVLAVGYGQDKTSGDKYWIVKNSWNTDWGEDGYIRLWRNSGDRKGECGILEDPSFPDAV